MKLLLTIPLVLAAVAIAEASGTRVIKQPPVILQPAQILVPAYGGSYGGTGAAQQQIGSGLDPELLRRLVEVLERLEANQNAPAGGHTAESITKASCAQCHTEGSARGGKAGPFLMFDKEGKPLELSLGDKRAVIDRIERTDSKRMPPEKSLPQQLQSIVIQSLTKGAQ